MFELQLINLINEYKKTVDIYSKEQIIGSITNLIKQNPQEYERFLQFEQFDNESKEILEKCEQKANESQVNSQVEVTESTDDVTIIRNYFIKWEYAYVQNNKQVNDLCSQIIEELLNFYMNNRFYVLEEVLKMEDTQNFESFKWHLKNKIREKLAIQIENYIESSDFKDLWFLPKFRKKYELADLLENIGAYNFDMKKIKEVLEE